MPLALGGEWHGRARDPPEFRRKVLDLVEAGRSVAEVARDLEISDQSIYTWRRQDRIDRGLQPGLTSGEKGELAKAKRRIGELETELRAMRRAMELVRAVVPQRRFEAVKVMAAEATPVQVACRGLDVSTSGSYAWRSRPPSGRANRHARPGRPHRRGASGRRGAYGARRVHAELRLGRGIVVGHGAIELLMRRAGLAGVTGRPNMSAPRRSHSARFVPSGDAPVDRRTQGSSALEVLPTQPVVHLDATPAATQRPVDGLTRRLLQWWPNPCPTTAVSVPMEVGNIMLSAISDGTFVARPGYFGDDATAEGHSDLFDRRGQAWLPIGCFLVRSGDRCVLVDAGMGPTESSAGDEDEPCRLFGGQLPVGLRAVGVERDEVTDVVCTHLHPDHVGWLFDLQSRPSFPRATIWFGAGDWRYFVEGRHAPLIQDHVHQGLRSHAGDARLRPIDRDTTVVPGVTAVQTPGHTPGHLCVVISSAGQRALLLGDAVTCPVQLDEPTWHSIGDVDPDLANRTRERLWRELNGEDVTGTGAHFPELKFGRVLKGNGKRWWT